MNFKILTLILSCFLFFNCSSDNDENGTTEMDSKKLVKRLTISSTDEPQNIFDFSYYKNGEVSEVLKNGEEKSVFEYNENKLTKLSNYNPDGSLFSYAIYSYDGNNKFTSQLYKNEEKLDKFDYYLNDLGVLSKMIYMDYDTYNYTYINGNTSSETINKQKILRSFDNSINPFTNHNLYFRILSNDYLYHTLSKNNPVIQEEFWNKESQTPNRIIYYEYIYDQDNYPINITGKNQYGETYMNYLFEYTK